MSEMKITIKQHYIPKVYLKHFKNKHSSKENIYIFLHKKSDSNKIEIILEGQKDITGILYKEFIYTNIPSYFKILEETKIKLKEGYTHYENSKEENRSKFKKEAKAIADIFINETEPKLREHLQMEVKEQGGDVNNQYIKKKIEEVIKKRNENFYVENSFLIELLIKKSEEVYLERGIKKIDIFLSETKINNEIENIEDLKKLSNLFHELSKDLIDILNNIRSELDDAKNKVEEITKNDKIYLEIEKECSRELNEIIFKYLKRINVTTIEQLQLKVKNLNEKSKILLENVLGKFENSCIFNKKIICSKNDYINEKFKDDFKFRIIKYILIQFYRMPDFNNKISEENLHCLKAILKTNNYKSLKKENKLKLLNFNGLLIEIEQEIFCTSDNPILYNEKSGILIFPLTPKMVFIIEETSCNNLNKNILTLKYKEHKNFIKNINYLIIKNSHKNIVSAVENIQFEEIALDNFIREYKFILRKYNLISQQKYI